MKKILFSFLGLFMAINLTYAGGIVTNTNQSAAWSRTLSRDASTSIDAAYYNPAGLTKLSDGLHLSLSNQSIFQKRTLTSDFTYLNEGEYKGNVSAPVYPNIYAAYKTGKFVFSFGFLPVGGGGTATFDKGIPLIELPVSTLVPTLASSAGVTGYSLNTNFEGSSVYFSVQGGISYKINDMISVFAGGRYVWAKNTYKGDLTDINVITASGSTPAPTFLTTLAGLATAGATNATGAAAGMQPLIDGGAGTLTFAQAEGGMVIDAATRAQLEGGLLQLGFTQTQIDAMDMSTAQGSYTGAAASLTTQAQTLAGTSALMGDQSADIEQTGNAFAPILGVNLSFMEDKLNFGIKYEFQTNMEVTNSTPAGMGFTVRIDPTTGAPVEMFPDEDVTNADIPALLTVGAKYKLTDALTVNAGFHYFFDKNTAWEKTTLEGTEYNIDELVDDNSYEVSFALEYNITDQLLISAGYLRTGTGVNEINYNSDIGYSLNSSSFGLGGAYKINDMLTLQVGGYFTSYETSTLNEIRTLSDNVTTIPYTQEYDKQNMAFAIGLDFTFGGTGE